MQGERSILAKGFIAWAKLSVSCLSFPSCSPPTSFDARNNLRLLFATGRRCSAVFRNGTTAGGKGGYRFMRMKWDRALKKPLAAGAICLVLAGAVCPGSKPGSKPTIQCSCSRSNGIATGRCVPQLHQLGRQRDRAGGRGRGGAGGHHSLAHRPGLWPMAFCGRGIARGLRRYAID